MNSYEVNSQEIIDAKVTNKFITTVISGYFSQVKGFFTESTGKPCLYGREF